MRAMHQSHKPRQRSRLFCGATPTSESNALSHGDIIRNQMYQEMYQGHLKLHLSQEKKKIFRISSDRTTVFTVLVNEIVKPAWACCAAAIRGSSDTRY